MRDKMKLMFLVEKFPPEINVAGLRMYEMVNSFSKYKNTDIKVVAYDPGSRENNLDDNIYISDNVKVARYISKYLPKKFYVVGMINPLTLFSWIFVLTKVIVNYRPDVIITTIPSWQPTIAAYISSIVFRTPFCIDIRDNWINTNMEDFLVEIIPWYGIYPSRTLYKFFRYLFLRSCKNALLISIVYESMHDELRGYINSDVPTINVPNGINIIELNHILGHFNKEQTLLENGILFGEDSKFVIYVGLVGGYYKPDMLLIPIKRSIDAGEDIRYIIVGDGPLKEIIKNTAEDLGIGDHVFLIGKRQHHEVIELLLASDVAFYALSEKFPNPDCALGVKVLEYIACKLPILALTGDNSIVSDLITEREIGLALRWNESDQMDNALQELLNNEKYSQNIEIYYESFIEEYDRQRNNNRLYREIVRHYHHK